MIRVRALVARFALDERAVAVALEDTIEHAQPWYVMALAGVGTWVGAFLIALALFTLDLFDSDEARIAAGLAILVAGACASRLNRGVVATQLAMIGSVAGQALLLSGLDDDVTQVHVGLLIELALLLAVDRALTRGLAALAFFGFVLAFLDKHHLPADAFPMLTAGAAAGAWLSERALLPTPLGVLVRPVGIAAVLALCGFLLFEAVVMSTGITGSPFHLASPPALAVGLGVLCAGALFAVARRRAGVHRPTAAVSTGGLLVGVLLSLSAPGLVAALLVVVLGVHARARLLIGVGIAFLFCFLALTYYRLDVTLTAKALWAGATGALVLVVRAFVLASADEGALSRLRRSVSTSAFRRERRAALLLVAAAALALAVPAALVVHKERVLAAGARVLLPLAPRDPRSLLQGDYMELRTVVASEALAALSHNGDARTDAKQGDGGRDGRDGRDEARSGRIVVQVDGDRVATFVRIDEGQPLRPDELRLKFRVRGQQWSRHVRVGAEELFFEEGASARFARARFGEVMVDGDGDTVLVGVRDEGRNPL